MEKMRNYYYKEEKSRMPPITITVWYCLGEFAKIVIEEKAMTDKSLVKEYLKLSLLKII